MTKFLWLQFSDGCTFEMCSAVIFVIQNSHVRPKDVLLAQVIRAAILFNQDTLIYIGAFLPLNAQFLLAKSDLC